MRTKGFYWVLLGSTGFCKVLRGSRRSRNRETANRLVEPYRTWQNLSNAREHREERLLNVKAILRLVEDDRCGRINHFVGHLIPAMCR